MTVYTLPPFEIEEEEEDLPSVGLRPPWMGQPSVKCGGLTNLFYPSRSNAEVARAKAVCNGLDGDAPCQWRNTCLGFAIDNNELYGVWGGTSERDRRKIRGARAKSGNTAVYNFEDVKFPHAWQIPTRTFVMVPRRSYVVVHRRTAG